MDVICAINLGAQLWPKLSQPHDFPSTHRGWLISSFNGGERDCFVLLRSHITFALLRSPRTLKCSSCNPMKNTYPVQGYLFQSIWTSLNPSGVKIDHAHFSEIHLTQYTLLPQHSPRRPYPNSKKQVGLERYGSEYK